MKLTSGKNSIICSLRIRPLCHISSARLSALINEFGLHICLIPAHVYFWGYREWLLGTHITSWKMYIPGWLAVGLLKLPLWSRCCLQRSLLSWHSLGMFVLLLRQLSNSTKIRGFACLCSKPNSRRRFWVIHLAIAKWWNQKFGLTHESICFTVSLGESSLCPRIWVYWAVCL